MIKITVSTLQDDKPIAPNKSQIYVIRPK